MDIGYDSQQQLHFFTFVAVSRIERWNSREPSPHEIRFMKENLPNGKGKRIFDFYKLSNINVFFKSDHNACFFKPASSSRYAYSLGQ